MNSLKLWLAIAMIVVFSSAGDVLLSASMKAMTDLDDIRKSRGLLAAIGRVFRERHFVVAVACLAVGFFSLITALSWGDASLVAPASASLTLLLSALIAKVFLKEDVDRRRWLAALLVGVGVVLVTQ
ncbi:MAG TPA: EamA family transporter [Alphaproteobacteria bacterium]|nr:EamA family transporter [Alphaproteobacteria bacterium]